MVKIVASVRETATGPGVKLAMVLLHARTTAHIKHWLTPSRSDHEALESFYEGIVGLVDSYTEGLQGKYGKIRVENSTYTFPSAEPLSYFLGLAQQIDELREMPGFPAESWLQNVVDEIRLLTSQTIYQLRELS